MLPELAQPKNSTALTLYLLLEHPHKGVTNYEAVVDCRHFKMASRTSDLILKHHVAIEKTIETGENRFKHSISSTRYKLRSEDLEKNIATYNLINEPTKKKSDGVDNTTE
jgi:hypothetical protein